MQLPSLMTITKLQILMLKYIIIQVIVLRSTENGCIKNLAMNMQKITYSMTKKSKFTCQWKGMIRMKKYNDEIMKAIRQRMGLNENDTSSDEEIMKLDKYDVFRQYCLWNGLMGSWYDTLLGVVENIYDVELKEEI